MKKYSDYLTLLASSLSLLAANLVVTQPAKAAVVCEMDTISYHNYQLEKCVLGRNFNVKLAGVQGVKYNVPCQAKSYIVFNKKGQLQSCQLAQTIRIPKGNAIDNCPAKANIFVAIGKKGDPSISCWHFR
jgi:hypothetical protein